jgi:hypothetical protein
MTPAPNFVGSYPGSGERIGPAWSAAWDALCQHQVLTGDQLSEIMCQAVDIKDKTAKNLLRKARSAGLLEVSYHKKPGQKYSQTKYKIVK